MADTPILNYKGKYDGPEIDKAVELALGLENPESCPYYVHISLSKPDYVLTIGLGDAEGNLFNHAEIDLPLESMVVNATYENGNIILHLQDGTSTEPIPISALIAGLVSETRTIAGVDLKDDITQKELRDALEVYTKDSIDQLVSDLEDRIDETLNEMKQSLNDLNELTSEHDTQIKKNTSDIATNKSDITTIDYAVGSPSKNIINNNISSRTSGGLTITVNEDKSVTFNGTATENVYYWVYGINISVSNQKKLPRGKYILTGCPKGGKQETYSLVIGYRQSPTSDRYAGYDVGNGYALNMNSDTGSVDILIQIRTGTIVDNLTFYPMLRHADITDPTYEPYKPSVNERVEDLEESVSELTPQVEQNKSDILTARNELTSMSSKMLISSEAKTVASKGWYRVFSSTVKGTSRNGLILLGHNYGTHYTENYLLAFNCGHQLNTFNMIKRFYEISPLNVITKIRLVSKQAGPQNNECYIDIYYNYNAANTVYVSILEDTENNVGRPFTPVKFTTAEIPEGYTSTEFDLTEGDVFDRIKKQKENDDILRNLIKLLLGGTTRPVTINGSFDASGGTTNRTNRIRTETFKVNAGDIVEIVNGSLMHGCGIWKGSVTASNNIRNDNGTINTNENVIIEHDGYMLVVFLRTDNANLTPDDFDGSVTLYKPIQTTTVSE